MDGTWGDSVPAVDFGFTLRRQQFPSAILLPVNGKDLLGAGSVDQHGKSDFFAGLVVERLENHAEGR